MKTKAFTKFTITSLFVFGLIFAFTPYSANAGQLPPPSNRKNVTFTKDIKPIFRQSCFRCHSGRRPKAHLRLNSLAAVLKGGRDGKVVIPGDSAKSPLVLRVAHLTKSYHDWMPPLHNRAGIRPLTPEQIGLIRAWIDQGAK